MSHDKIDINLSLANSLVNEQFPQWANLSVTPVELSGWDNRMFRLGDDMVIRLPSALDYAVQIKKEQLWLPKLAPQLPLPIPQPLALGVPARGYPLNWSVYQWLEGENATRERVSDMSEFATSLANFLTTLYQLDTTGGPLAGEHSFFRGSSLTVYDAETRNAITTLGQKLDLKEVTGVWEAALKARWHGTPVWFHGDVTSGNLLVNKGQLSAVIDFGCSGIGDPACDLTIAWTFLSSESREAFRTAMALGNEAWARARGWALWKALITMVANLDTNPDNAQEAERIIHDVLADYRKFS